MPFRPDGALARTSIQGLFNLAVNAAAEHYATLRGVAEGADPATVLGQPAG
jgi:hypothetical protein